VTRLDEDVVTERDEVALVHESERALGVVSVGERRRGVGRLGGGRGNDRGKRGVWQSAEEATV
jgi:hypothetical protein